MIERAVLEPGPKLFEEAGVLLATTSESHSAAGVITTERQGGEDGAVELIIDVR